MSEIDLYMVMIDWGLLLTIHEPFVDLLLAVSELLTPCRLFRRVGESRLDIHDIRPGWADDHN